MHEWLYKQWRNTDTIRSIYERLYEGAEYYDDVDQFLDTSSEILGTKNQELRTYVIWWPIDTVSDRAFVSLDTRSREIRHRRPHESEDSRIVIRAYRSSVGREYFIAMETSQWYLYGFTRLSLPDIAETIEYTWLGESTALIRELHVYGQVASLRPNNQELGTQTQHTGVGRTVMAIAEKISQQAWYHRLSVIAGVGVKEYYRNQLWYHDDGTYVVKNFNIPDNK
jgi:histone acetyltransferase (RNA polymerase elongator complex component)